MSTRQRYRSIWLSDIHLGTRACRAHLLLDFLAHSQCETLYLVGDVIDLESLRRRFFWPRSHTEVMRAVLRMANDGTRVVYVPGNHDEDLRVLAGTRIGPVEIEHRCEHETADGRRLLVLHGDEFDRLLACGPLAALAGSIGYRALLVLNRMSHRTARLLGRPYWSLARTVKSRFGKAQRYVARFQQASLAAARAAGLDGVICGHIHQAAVLEQDGLTYCNDGDWVENCSALVENEDGDLSLVHWRPTEAALSFRFRPGRRQRWPTQVTPVFDASSTPLSTRSPGSAPHGATRPRFARNACSRSS